MGFRLIDYAVFPEKFIILRDSLKILNYFQNLLGDINWIYPYLNHTTGELKPIFDILKRSPDPIGPRSLTSGLLALQQVERAIENLLPIWIIL